MPGVKIPLKGGLVGEGPTHVPNGSGAPVSNVKRFTEGSLKQYEPDPFPPAFGDSFSNTETTAVSFAHGDTPTRMYK